MSGSSPVRSTVTVSALSAGSLTLPERFFIDPADPEARRTVPSLCFLVQHTSGDKTTRIVFDLGLRRDVSTYSDPIRKHCTTRQPMTTEPDVVLSLAQGDLTPDDIDYVILSHVHYDHIGQPNDFANPHTKFIIGPGALDLLSGKSSIQIGSHSFFEPHLLPIDRTIELPHPSHTNNSTVSGTMPPPATKSHALPTPAVEKWTWTPLSTFPHTIDLFSDGSVYIVNAPGHLPGHINLLIRLPPTDEQQQHSTASPTTNNNIDQSANNSNHSANHSNHSTHHNSKNTPYPRSVYLGGDAYHDIRLFHGTHAIATWTDPTSPPLDSDVASQPKICCIHADRDQARETINTIRDFQESESKAARAARRVMGNTTTRHTASQEHFGDVEVVVAHDWAWEADARKKERFWPGFL